MPRLLSGDPVGQHRRDGSSIRIRVLSPIEACRCRDSFAPDNLLEEPSKRDLTPETVARRALIMRRRRLEQVNPGFAGMAKGNVVRVVLLLN